MRTWPFTRQVWSHRRIRDTRALAAAVVSSHLESLVDAHGGQSTVDVAITTAEKVAIGGAQVSVEEGVDEGVHEGVGVAQPQQRALQPDGNAAALHPADEGPRGGEDEERQPAHGEHAHDHPQRRGRFLLALKDGDVPALAAQQAGQGGALLRHARRLQALHAQRLVGHRFEALAPRQVGEAVLGAALASCPEDLVVHDQHDQHRDVKGHGCGVDGVAKVLANEAHASCVDIFSPAAKRWQGDRRRHQPHTQDHLRHQLTVLPGWVGEGPCDPQVPGRERGNIA